MRSRGERVNLEYRRSTLAGFSKPHIRQILRPAMCIARCQFEPWVGDFEHNLARFEGGLERTAAEGAKIVSFRERFFSGARKESASLKWR